MINFNPSCEFHSVADIVEYRSSLTIEQHAKLALLRPLGHDNMHPACRNLDSATDEYCELLNLQPLDLFWRRTFAKAPPVSHMTFDLSLPVVFKWVGNETKMQQVLWSTDGLGTWDLAVKIQDVMTIVLTLATSMRMRVKGDLKFEATYFDEGPAPSAMALLQKQLSALATSESKQESEDGESIDSAPYVYSGRRRLY
jgi:hypothetical protein